ncbi:hypothetical protein OG921_14035 [Aldersonia sp. NBC_00410]|uniref:hypothetical protein n=1 Tax=Aldersonia sp. NBC_00410 TaxID=2975954 RepID=UPI00224E44A7|nr:hypothetical protein [Aldersonia sp. NBC_00410]MCX5044287.1 hypothetical protein [Aldersonia sp. NBC_00410]
MAVLGTSVAEIVQHAGGLLFDYGIAGWDLIVLGPADTRCRALQILGTHTFTPDSALSSSVNQAALSGEDPQIHVVVGAEGLFRDQPRMNEAVSELFDCNCADVMLWSNPNETDLPRMTKYRMSNAARAFKAQALCAAGTTPLDGDAHTEFFIPVRTSGGRIAVECCG